ncbi:hypothetical protein ACJJTC_010527 [Scirpophaga incertulas]
MDQLLKGCQMPDGVIDLFIRKYNNHYFYYLAKGLSEVSNFPESSGSLKATTDTATSASSNTDYDFSSVPEQIDGDFNILFPGRQDCFRQNWQPICKKIFQLKASEIKSDDYKEDLLSSLNCLRIDEEKIPTELALLVHTVPPNGRTCKKRKFSVRECLESIMIIVEVNCK